MKKMHIFLMGAVMVMVTPALAEETHNINYQNDNTRPAAESGAVPKPISYDDYAANDDDHGDEDEHANSARLGFASSPQTPGSNNSR